MANKYYKITDWKGYPNYECLHCAFSTLDKPTINQHVDVHIRAGLVAGDPAPVEKLDENFGLDVKAEAGDNPQDTQKAAKPPKKKKGRVDHA